MMDCMTPIEIANDLCNESKFELVCLCQIPDQYGSHVAIYGPIESNPDLVEYTTNYTSSEEPKKLVSPAYYRLNLYKAELFCLKRGGTIKVSRVEQDKDRTTTTYYIGDKKLQIDHTRHVGTFGDSTSNSSELMRIEFIKDQKVDLSSQPTITPSGSLPLYDQ